MSYQEQKAREGMPASVIFAFSLGFVFLILAALNESWTLPFSALLSTPVAIFGAFAVLWLRRVTTPTGRAMAALLSVFAEFEHEILRERIRAGIAEARLNGKHLGRPLTVAKKSGEIRKLYRSGASKAEIARQLNISRTSVRRILGERNHP
jgi:hypothetical protein